MNFAKEIVNDASMQLFLNALKSSDLMLDESINFERRLNYLRKFFSCKESKDAPEIIYNQTAREFLLRYGFSNLFKNYYMITELYQLGIMQNINRIIDLGCGPGTFALATLLWLIDSPSIPAKEREIVMSDGADECIKIFNSIWNNIDVEQKNSLKINAISNKSLGELPKEIHWPNLIVFSNSLTEMLRDDAVNNETLYANLINSGSVILVIDFLYQNTQQHLNVFTERLANHYDNCYFNEWPSWNNFFSEVDLDKIEQPIDALHLNNNCVASNIKFVKSILVPKNKSISINHPWSSDLVMQYKRAWEKHDINILRNLFTHDAIYVEKINEEPLFGIDNICKYWIANSKLQEDVEFLPRHVKSANDRVEVIWQCRFYRNDIHNWMLLNGKFIADTRENKILSFKETFYKFISSTKPHWSEYTSFPNENESGL